MQLTGAPGIFLSCISQEKPEPGCLTEVLFRHGLSELLHSDRFEAQSTVVIIATVLPLPRFLSLGFKALLQTLKSCSPEPQGLRLNRACSEMLSLLL